jgi:hypothetical protein
MTSFPEFNSKKVTLSLTIWGRREYDSTSSADKVIFFPDLGQPGEEEVEAENLGRYVWDGTRGFTAGIKVDSSGQIRLKECLIRESELPATTFPAIKQDNPKP